jgi:hypothetical protein
MEFVPIDPSTVAPVELCPHGLPRDEYCYRCTYVEKPSTQELEARTVTVTLDVLCEPHWTLDELHASVVEYLSRYIDEQGPGYQPETYYIRGIHGQRSDSADNSSGRDESHPPV